MKAKSNNTRALDQFKDKHMEKLAQQNVMNLIMVLITSKLEQ